MPSRYRLAPALPVLIEHEANPKERPIMNTQHFATVPQDRLEQSSQPLDDAALWQFDDEALERALKTVSCNPQDIRQFLRAANVR